LALLLQLLSEYAVTVKGQPLIRIEVTKVSNIQHIPASADACLTLFEPVIGTHPPEQLGARPKPPQVVQLPPFALLQKVIDPLAATLVAQKARMEAIRVSCIVKMDWSGLTEECKGELIVGVG
jgi:hypothetical protein